MELYVINWLIPLLMLELYLHFIMLSSSQQEYELLSIVHFMWQWYTLLVSLHSYVGAFLCPFIDIIGSVMSSACSGHFHICQVLADSSCNLICVDWEVKPTWSPSTNSGNSSRFLFTSHLFSLHQWQTNQFWQAMWVKSVWLICTWIRDI